MKASGTYLITSIVYTNRMNTLVTLSINEGRDSRSFHHNIAWTDGSPQTAMIAEWNGLSSTLMLKLVENDIFSLNVHSGGLSLRQIPPGSLDTGIYSVKLSIVRIEADRIEL